MLNDRLYRNFNIAAVEGSTGLKIEGRAIAFDKPTLIQGMDTRGQKRKFYEVIDPHALDSCDMADVPLRAEHDTKTIYARTRNKSLILDVRPDGLYIRADLLDNEESRTLHEKIRSGLVPQMSFAFPLDSKTVDDGTLNGLPRRRVMQIPRLLDVSVVAYAAYGDDTYVTARSFDWMVEREQARIGVDRRVYQLKADIEKTITETTNLLGGTYE